MSDIEFPVGEYVDEDGERCTVLGAAGAERWLRWQDGVHQALSVWAMKKSFDLKPYVAPVVVERWMNIYPDNGGCIFESALRAQQNQEDIAVGLLKLTFEDSKLVKAEVQE